ncbi:hypothetical protein HZB02_03630 [Candidatus Woesearchaeota archaeon]|nr:hypothetical protein [Candidatus Woesearchaeota archaeon]
MRFFGWFQKKKYNPQREREILKELREEYNVFYGIYQKYSKIMHQYASSYKYNDDKMEFYAAWGNLIQSNRETKVPRLLQHS